MDKGHFFISLSNSLLTDWWLRWNWAEWTQDWISKLTWSEADQYFNYCRLLLSGGDGRCLVPKERVYNLRQSALSPLNSTMRKARLLAIIPLIIGSVCVSAPWFWFSWRQPILTARCEQRISPAVAVVAMMSILFLFEPRISLSLGCKSPQNQLFCCNWTGWLICGGNHSENENNKPTAAQRRDRNRLGSAAGKRSQMYIHKIYSLSVSCSNYSYFHCTHSSVGQLRCGVLSKLVIAFWLCRGVILIVHSVWFRRGSTDLVTRIRYVLKMDCFALSAKYLENLRTGLKMATIALAACGRCAEREDLIDLFVVEFNSTKPCVPFDLSDNESISQ